MVVKMGDMHLFNGLLYSVVGEKTGESFNPVSVTCIAADPTWGGQEEVVGELGGLARVVGDEQGGKLPARDDVTDQNPETSSHSLIQAVEGLIE